MGWFLFFSAIVVIIFIGIKYKNLKSENEKIIVKSKQDLQECKNRTSRLLKENKNKYEAEISFLNNQINHLSNNHTDYRVKHLTRVRNRTTL